MNTFCSYFNQGICRSCDLITTDYPDQIKFKEKLLKDSLQDFKSAEFLPTINSSPLNFRNKAKLVVTGTMNDPVIGLWGEKNLDQGRELLECGIHVKEINELLPDIKSLITLAKLEPYQIATKKGELKGLIIFYSETSQESYLRFVLRSKESLDRIKKHLSQLTTKFPHLKCISANIQPVAHAILEGEEEIFFTEAHSISHGLGEVTFSLGPRAFVQTNQQMAEKLYSTAAQWIKRTHERRFMELFCGQGAFSFFCAPFIDEGLGIEINPDAIKEAVKTARKFNFHNLTFKSADAALVEDELMKFRPDILLVNPPRRGLAESVKLILKHKPQTVLYSSCNYETLSQDLKILKDDYEVRRVQLFDMFPHTKHFETLVELSRTTEGSIKYF